MSKSIKRLNPASFFHDPQWIWLLGDSTNNLFTFDFEGYTLQASRGGAGITIKNGGLSLLLRLPYSVSISDTNDSANMHDFFYDPTDPTEAEIHSFNLCHPKLVHRAEELARVYHKIIAQMRTYAHLRAFTNNQIEAKKNLRRKTEWMSN